MIYRELGKNKGVKRLHCFIFVFRDTKYMHFQIITYLIFSQL